jgi:hypothetical protein
MSTFMKGLDCSAEVSAHLALEAQPETAAQAILPSKMNWPVVHRVSRAKSALKCTDCHEMNEVLRADFKVLGYSDKDLDKLTWKNEEFPAITDNDLNLIVAESKPGSSWIYWLLGVAVIFAIFEFFVARKLRKPDNAVKEGSDGRKS